MSLPGFLGYVMFRALFMQFSRTIMHDDEVENSCKNIHQNQS